MPHTVVRIKGEGEHCTRRALALARPREGRESGGLINPHTAQCPCCKRRVTATPPAAMTPGSPFGRRRSVLADATIAAHRRRLAVELARVLDLQPLIPAGRKLRDAIDLDAREKLLVFLTRRDIEPANNASERALRLSVIFRKVTNGFRSIWGAKVYADVCSIVATARINGQSALAAIRAILARPAAA